MATEESAGSLPRLEQSFQVGDWRVDPKLDRISRNGRENHLEPRVMTVLTLLAAQPGEVLSREQLEAGAWGNLVVGYDSLSSCINKLRKALGDDSHNPLYIETVSKKGYRLVAQVSGVAPKDDPVSGNLLLRQFAMVVVGAVLLFVATLTGIFIAGSDGIGNGAALNDSVRDTKRLAVLPFINLAHRTTPGYLVDGMTDDLITSLSNLSGVVVISRSASYQYQGKQFSPAKVGQELGADYLVEGSVRRTGERWRINVSLIKAADGSNLWAQTFDNPESSLFDIQDQIARRITGAMALRLSDQDRRRLDTRPTTNFEAYDLFLLGQKQFKERTREANRDAQESYRAAIRLDPNFARAYGALAVALDVDYWRGWSEAPAETLHRALEMAKYAVEIDPGSPQAYWALGYTYLYHKQQEKAAEAVERAIRLAPNYADGYGLLALVKNHLGDAEAALSFIRKGMELNAHYTWDYPYNEGRAFYTLGRYTEAASSLKRALERNNNAILPRVYLAAVYAADDRMEDAAWEVDNIKMISPESTIRHLEKNYPIADRKLREDFLRHLRKAGLPE